MEKKKFRIFAKNFALTEINLDPSTVDLDKQGLHLKITYDNKMYEIKKEWYKEYNDVDDIFSDLIVKEERIYTWSGPLPKKKETIYTYYNDEGGIEFIRDTVVKYYTPQKGFKKNKRTREGLLEKASMYLYATLMDADINIATANIDDYDDLTELSQAKYVKSNMQPLLTIITNSTDNTKSEYRSYMTEAMRDTMLSILNITYT